MNKYYQPSGKTSLLSFVYFLFTAFTVLPLLSWLSVYGISLSLPKYFHVAIALAFSTLIGLTLYYFVIGAGKVRNQNLATALGSITGLLALYMHWALWIDLQSGSKSWTFFNQLGSINMNPVDLFTHIIEINKSYEINILSVHLRGAFITIIWVVEAAIIVGIPTAFALTKAKEPFNEAQNTWATKVVLPPYEYIETGWWLRSTLEDEDSTFLKSVKRTSTLQKSHSIFTLYDCGLNKYYLSINNRMAKMDANGKLKFEDDKFLEQILIDKTSAEFLLTIETSHFQAKPDRQSSWSMETI